jgi:Zn-dependent protease with chaperone function
LEEKGIKRDTLLATGIISCLILLFLSTQTKNAFLRSGEEFADKNALKYISTKEKVKVIAQLTSYQLQGYPPDATHPSLEKRIEWVKESIGRENLLSRIYAKVLLCFFLPAMHTKLALKNMLEK